MSSGTDSRTIWTRERQGREEIWGNLVVVLLLEFEQSRHLPTRGPTSADQLRRRIPNPLAPRLSQVQHSHEEGFIELPSQNSRGSRFLRSQKSIHFSSSLQSVSQCAINFWSCTPCEIIERTRITELCKTKCVVCPGQKQFCDINVIFYTTTHTIFL